MSATEPKTPKPEEPSTIMIRIPTELKTVVRELSKAFREMEKEQKRRLIYAKNRPE